MFIIFENILPSQKSKISQITTFRTKIASRNWCVLTGSRFFLTSPTTKENWRHTKQCLSLKISKKEKNLSETIISDGSEFEWILCGWFLNLAAGMDDSAASGKSGVRTRKRNKSIKDSAKLVSDILVLILKLWRGCWKICQSMLQSINWMSIQLYVFKCFIL